MSTPEGMMNNMDDIIRFYACMDRVGTKFLQDKAYEAAHFTDSPDDPGRIAIGLLYAGYVMGQMDAKDNK